MLSFGKEYFEEFNKIFGIKDDFSQIERKYLEKTYKYIGYIKNFPGLRMVAVGNSLSMKSATEKSDIDLFIVTTPNTLWLNRLLITAFFWFLGVRKNKKKHAGRFCLSFFVTTNGLNFGTFALKNDIYLYFWIVYLKPILDYNKTYEKFLEENKKWADFKDYQHFFDENTKYIKFFGEKKREGKFIIFLNKILKKIFLPKTKRTFEKLGKPFGIVITNDILKFHDKDIRREVIKKFDKLEN